MRMWMDKSGLLLSFAVYTAQAEDNCAPQDWDIHIKKESRESLLGEANIL